MVMSPDTREYDLACLIVNFGLGSKVLRIAKANGVAGGTVFIGRGTLKSRWLEFFEINESRKEIVLMVSRKDVIRKVLPILNHELGLCKPNHGIAFRTELSSIAGSRPVNRPEYKPEPEKVGEKMYQAIYVIVSKGKAEDVVDAAAAAGARGGTIINARGSGIHETSKVFSMYIEPEKEIVLILAEASAAPAIIQQIKSDLELEKPGNGILFVQEVLETFGIC